jgi:c(7)-type cytochrome triheme protein
MVGRNRTTIGRYQYPNLVAVFWILAVHPGFPQTNQDQDLIFSHRKHLARQPECVQCHTSILWSTSAQDRNLPGEKTCLTCHDGARAGKECALCHTNPGGVQPRATPGRHIRFNHQLHLSFGNLAPAFAKAIDTGRYLSEPGDMRRHLNTENACLACHRGILETDLATRANLPAMADCLVCHTRIDPPFSCGFCHTPEFELKPASHTAKFADAHSSRKAVPDKSTCKICHGAKFTCMGCH